MRPSRPVRPRSLAATLVCGVLATGTLALPAAASAPGQAATGTAVPLLSTAAAAAGLAGLSGTGSQEDPVRIRSVADLQSVVAAVNGDHAAFGHLAYRLDADLDLAGATLTTFATFSGTFDGAGHVLRNAVYERTRTTALFGVLESATVHDLTLDGVTAVTENGDGVAAALAGHAYDTTVRRVSVLDSEIRLGAGGAVNTQAGGLVASIGPQRRDGTPGTSVLADNLVRDSRVTGHKYAGGLVGYPNSVGKGPMLLERNLVVGTEVHSDTGGSGATAAGIAAQGGAGRFRATGNVVLGGTVRRTGTGTSAGLGYMGSDANWSADNLVASSTRVTGGTVLGVPGTPATTTPGTEPDLPDLTQPNTWQDSGWDLADVWRWSPGLGHPVPVPARLPGEATLTFDLAGGTTSEDLPTSLPYESAALTLPAPTRRGHTFLGWTGTGLDQPVPDLVLPPGSRGDRAFTATWQLDEHPLTLDAAGGLVTGAPDSYTVETPTFTLPVPTRSGYAFAGWTGTDLDGPTREVTVPTGSVGERAYTATWQALEFPLRYDLAGGTVVGNRVTYTIEDATFHLVAPTRDGYEFAGWTGTGLAGPAVEVSVAAGSQGERSYVATWVPRQHQLAYDAAGGQLPAGNPARYSVESPDLTLLPPTRRGHTFTGWTGTGLAGPTLTVRIPRGSSGARAYLATWAVQQYPLTVDPAGGALPAAVPATYSVGSAPLRLPTPTRAGYRFTGWVGTGLAAATETVVLPTGSVGARAYRATWVPAEVAQRRASTLSLSGVRPVKPGRTPRVRVRLRGSDGIAATGRVRLTFTSPQHPQVTRSVTVRAGGTTVSLPAKIRRHPGTWRVRATHRGSDSLLPSTSRILKVTVRR